MTNSERWSCPTCLQHNPFSQPMIFHDGQLGKCQRCGTRAIRHNCSSNSQFRENIEWLPILMTGIGLACPMCKTTYQIAEKVTNSPDTPEWLKTVATVVGAVAIVVGVIKVGEKIEEAFS